MIAYCFSLLLINECVRKGLRELKHWYEEVCGGLSIILEHFPFIGSLQALAGVESPVNIELLYSLVIGRALLSTLLHVEDTVFHWHRCRGRMP